MINNFLAAYGWSLLAILIPMPIKRECKTGEAIMRRNKFILLHGKYVFNVHLHDREKLKHPCQRCIFAVVKDTGREKTRRRDD